jgi:hypothetical protein
LEDLFNLINAQDERKSALEAQHTAYLQDISERVATMQAAAVYPKFLDTLLEMVNADPKQMLTSMQSVLQRETHKLGREEKQFLQAGIDRLQEQTSVHVTINSWTVSGLEVERGFLLGGDTTARARLGMWRHSVILILELKSDEVRREPTLSPQTLIPMVLGG